MTPKQWSRLKKRMAKWDEYAIMETAKKEGMEQGIKQAQKEIVKNMLMLTDFSATEIARHVNVTEEFVHEMKKKMKDTQP